MSDLLTVVQVEALLILDDLAEPWWNPGGLTVSNRTDRADKVIASPTARALEGHGLIAVVAGTALLTDKGHTTAGRIRDALGHHLRGDT